MLFALVLANIDGRSRFFTRGDKIVQIFQPPRASQCRIFLIEKVILALKYLNDFVAPRKKARSTINISKDQCKKHNRPSILARTSAKSKINNQYSQGPLQKASSTVNIRKDQCKKQSRPSILARTSAKKQTQHQYFIWF